MCNLRLIVLAVAMLVPVSPSHAGLWRAMARGAASAGAVERAAATAVSVEKAGAAAVKAGAGAERGMATALKVERAAANLEMSLAREARDFGVKRANDGRFMLDAGRASARLVQGRVGAALAKSPPGVVLRAADGRMMRLALATQHSPYAAELVLVADQRQAGNASNQQALEERIVLAADQAILDTVGTAFRYAVLTAREIAENDRANGLKGRSPALAPAQLRADIKDLLRSIQSDEVLADARRESVAMAAGTPGASLLNVQEVLLYEQKGKPAMLFIQLAPIRGFPKQPVLAHVNLDALLARIPMEGL